MPRGRIEINDDNFNKRKELSEEVVRSQLSPKYFVENFFPWKNEGPLEKEEGLDGWQEGILETIEKDLRAGKDNIRVAVASGHGIGKTALISFLVLSSVIHGCLLSLPLNIGTIFHD